jgi:bifunctional polynucleotide phosphatase/kinase
MEKTHIQMSQNTISIHRGKNKKYFAKHSSLLPNRRHFAETGFFFTCTVGNELKTISKVQKWLETTVMADLALFAPDYKWGPPLQEAMQEAMQEKMEQKESIETMQQGSVQQELRKLIQVVDSGTSGIVTLRCYLPNQPKLSTTSILERIWQKLDPNHVNYDKEYAKDTLKVTSSFARIIPFQYIIHATPPTREPKLYTHDIICEEVVKLITPQLPTDAVFKVSLTAGRSNTFISGKKLERELCEALSLETQRKINLSNPHWTVVVEVVKSWVSIAVVEGNWEDKMYWKRGNLGLFIEMRDSKDAPELIQPAHQKDIAQETIQLMETIQEQKTTDLKRKAEPEVDQAKKKPMHSFFQKQTLTTKSVKLSWSWPHETLLFASTEPISLDSQPPLEKKFIAAFDLDGSLIVPKSGAKFPKDEGDWMWLYPTKTCLVMQQLQNSRKSPDAILLLTNQGGLKNLKKDDKKVLDFKKRLDAIVSKLGVDKVFVLAATGNDVYRKPSIGMFDHFIRDVLFSGAKIDVGDYTLVDEASFFVGDAAGRLDAWKHGKRKDFADTDRRMAENVGLKFLTPEEFFLDEPATNKWKWKSCWTPTMPTTAPKLRPETNLEWLKTQDSVLVVLCGSPASGKSSFAHSGFQVVNQDTLKSRDACVSAVEGFLMSGKRVCVDNTNPEASTRALYILAAKRVSKALGKPIPVYCIHFPASIELAKHNNRFRSVLFDLMPSFGKQVRDKAFHVHEKPLPDIAFNTFFSKFQKPNVQEGFDEVYTMDPWPRFLLETSSESKIKTRLWKMIHSS